MLESNLAYQRRTGKITVCSGVQASIAHQEQSRCRVVRTRLLHDGRVAIQQDNVCSPQNWLYPLITESPARAFPEPEQDSVNCRPSLYVSPVRLRSPTPGNYLGTECLGPPIEHVGGSPTRPNVYVPPSGQIGMLFLQKLFVQSPGK